MQIGIDARLATGKRRGMGRVLSSLLASLSKIDNENSYHLYLNKADNQQELPKTPNFQTHILSPRLYPAWEQMSLPLICAKHKVDLLHCPANTIPLFVPKSIKLLVTLHDLIFLKPLSEVPLSTSPYQNLGRLYRSLCATAIKCRASLIITVSEWSQQEIQERLGIMADKIRVVPNGVDDQFFKLKKDACASILIRLGINFPYILHLGAIAPHKNTPLAIESFRLLTKDPCYEGLRLVIVGLSADALVKSIPSFLGNTGQHDRIFFTGYVSDQELACLYKGAELLLFPSAYEGFGLPALEAMACGTPVVASKGGSIPEVVGDSAILIDNINTEEICSAMLKVLEDDTMRYEMIKAGQRQAMQYRWEVSAKRLLSVYNEALDM